VDDLAIGTLHEMIIQAVQDCMDPEVLDLIYKLLGTL
jgi:hypothetical protein